MISIAMQLGLAPQPIAKPAKARRHLMDGSKAEAKVDRTLSATQAMHARRAEIVAMLEQDGPMFRREIQEWLTMPATLDQLNRDMTELVKSGVIRARGCYGITGFTGGRGNETRPHRNPLQSHAVLARCDRPHLH